MSSRERVAAASSDWRCKLYHRGNAAPCFGQHRAPYQLPDGPHLRERADRGSMEVVAIDSWNQLL